MLLDRIDIDAHGPLKHVELGPLAEHLNVVFAPVESGKTAISRFVRDALVDRDYPRGMFSSSTGRVVLADRNGLVHCRREQDGTAHGRRSVSFESRGDFCGHYDAVESAWLHDVSKSSDAISAIASLEIPEAIVDSVVTDTSNGSVARVVSACVRSGLDSASFYQSLPLQEDSIYADRNARTDSYSERRYDRNRRLRRELADVEAELARHSADEADYDSLIARRQRLTSRLTQPILTQPILAQRAPVTSSRSRLEQRSTDLQHRARNLRTRQSELRRRIADLELDIASCDLGRRPGGRSHQHGRQDYPVLCRDRDAILGELDRVSISLDACLGDAANVSRKLRSHAALSGRTAHHMERDERRERDTMNVEIRNIDDRLAVLSRIEWLRTRQSELLRQMRVRDVTVRSESPLSDAAGRWLVQLSGGRLRQVAWPDARFDRDQVSDHHDTCELTGVTIDGRDETQCNVLDRTLATLAIRMAAGDLMARSGRHLPLVFEIPVEAFHANTTTHANDRAAHAYFEAGDHLRSNHPLAAALRDYVQAGRQLLVLTSSPELTQQLTRVGARSFEVHTHRLTHPHRPLWRSQYKAESYAGPHPHTYAERDALDVSFSARHDSPKAESSADVNRDFDIAWHESQDTARRVPPQTGTERSHRTDPSHRTDWARDGVSHRDGIYYTDTYTTAIHPSKESSPAKSSELIQPSKASPASPYYLTVDSPIDQAPSVDAVASARLRGVKVTHVTHLMQRDPNRLSDALGLASVDAATIRRWQAECRLACRVPNLRGFDARVLVGCGVTTPGQLAAIHPTDLLHDVEAFLATESGQQLLLSGTSQELSRITTWIATANSAADRKLTGLQDSRSGSQRGRIIRTMNERDALLQTGRPLSTDDLVADTRRRRRASAHVVAGDRSESEAAKHPRGKRRQRRRKTVMPQDANQSSVVAYESSPRDRSQQQESSRVGPTLRFYLDRDCPVVDAPSIGPRMADRLQGTGIVSVDDLLVADPEIVANELDHHRVDADTVMQWQQQTALVCRVPMLRGHDAQLLVAAGVTSPEELAESDASDLFTVVDVIARSGEGKRILRGGNLPDLQEVSDWIRYAGHQRELRAA